MRFASVVILAMLGVGQAALAAEADQAYVAAVDRALAGGRLVQAEAMLAREDIQLADPDRQRLTASLLLATHRDAEARSIFEAQLRQRPDDCRLQFGAGLAALRLGKTAEATSLLTKATSACPDNGKAWDAMAVIENKAGHWDAALAAHYRAIAIAPDDADILNNAGVSLLEQKKFAQAISLFKQALQRDPAHKRARNNLDIARVAGGEQPSFDQEDDSRRRAERLNNAGYAALLSGQQGVASRYFTQAIKTDPFRFETAEANLRSANQDDDVK
jgi:Tfp pilus assembly protein PilF